MRCKKRQTQRTVFHTVVRTQCQFVGCPFTAPFPPPLLASFCRDGIAEGGEKMREYRSSGSRQAEATHNMEGKVSSRAGAGNRLIAVSGNLAIQKDKRGMTDCSALEPCPARNFVRDATCISPCSEFSLFKPALAAASLAWEPLNARLSDPSCAASSFP
jgi:hypothetical protein